MSTIDSGHYGDGVARWTKRLWMHEEKRSICLQTTVPSDSVAQVARRYAMNAPLIFEWLRYPVTRRELDEARKRRHAAATVNPVRHRRFRPDYYICRNQLDFVDALCVNPAACRCDALPVSLC